MTIKTIIAYALCVTLAIVAIFLSIRLFKAMRKIEKLALKNVYLRALLPTKDPVVRCKDCALSSCCVVTVHALDEEWGVECNTDQNEFYCAYGKRKEN